MNIFLENVSQYIRNHPLKYEGRELESVADLFYECCWESGMEDNRIMRHCVHRIYELTSPETGDLVLNALSEFCEEARRQAFREGLRVGAQWILEVNTWAEQGNGSPEKTET